MSDLIKKHSIELTPEEAELVRRPIKGQGGWQSLLEELQWRLKPDNTISLPVHTNERVRRYALDYGGVGWEQRLLDGILSALKRAGVDPDNP